MMQPPNFLHDEHDLPHIMTDILMAELIRAHQYAEEIKEPWISELCRVAERTIHGLRIENAWVRVRSNISHTIAKDAT